MQLTNILKYTSHIQFTTICLTYIFPLPQAIDRLIICTTIAMSRSGFDKPKVSNIIYHIYKFLIHFPFSKNKPKFVLHYNDIIKYSDLYFGTYTYRNG